MLNLLICMSFEVGAQVPDAEVFDPVGWAEEQTFYKHRQDQLLSHITGAKNIEVAKGWQGVAPWPINWDAQQKFCHRVADVLFKEPHRLTFPEPQFSAYRDPAEKLREVLPVSYPNCASMNHDVESTIRYVKERYGRRKANDGSLVGGGRTRYYVEKDLFIREYRDPSLNYVEVLHRSPSGGWQAEHELRDYDVLTYDYRAGMDSKGCPVWGASVIKDNDWDRDEDSKMVLTRIDDEYVFIEIGTFSVARGVSAAEAKSIGDWFSTAGKRYVTATGVHNNLYYTLVPESRREKNFIYDARLNIYGVEQNWAEPYAYACVINFDGPEAGRTSAKPAHSLVRGN
jgi:hypothetical protein